MSMEIKGNYENNYLEKMQAKKLENANSVSGDGDKKLSEHVPTPKDEYISREKSGVKVSGLYRMGQDENGNPKVMYDAPWESGKDKAVETVGESEKSAEKTTTNTDKVDREIKKLKEDKKQIEQQIKAVVDDEKKKELERKLSQIESELSLKDNDTYRRQNSFVS